MGIQERVHGLGSGVRGQVRRHGPTVLAAIAGCAAVAWLFASGTMDDTSNTLQVMGFDPDRAALLDALVGGAVGAAIVSLLGGAFAVAVITGGGLVLAAFADVFRAETGNAIHLTGAAGRFDAGGWLLTTLTLGFAALLTGWTAATLAVDLRTRIRAASRSARTLARGPRSRRAFVRVAGAVLVVAVSVVGVPTFGDMLNFDPDVHMISGGVGGVSLFGGTADASASPAPGEAVPSGPATAIGGRGTTGARQVVGVTPNPRKAEALVPPPGLVTGPVPSSYMTANALSSARPWASDQVAGSGRTFSVNLPAPWVGGLTNFATIDIYLPPGYDGGTRRYPVVYEPHQPLWAWQQGMHVTDMLDNLIVTHAIPPEIVVFVGQYGGPYADSECADSVDGKEWFDRYLGQQVPSWVDQHLRSIATPAARSLLGFSSGGYCAAAAITHHPDVFRSAMIFSGYYVAGIQSSTTPTAGRPFNNDPAVEAKVSPVNVVPTIPASIRSQLFIAFSADPTNRFYGSQITSFANVLTANGVDVAILPTPLGHSWTAVREQLPVALETLAARQALLGVFGN